MIYLFVYFIINRLEDSIDVVFGDIIKLHVLNIFSLSLDDILLFCFSGIIIRSIGIS